MNSYKALNKQIFNDGNYALVPLRFEDRFDIRQWRNEQIYHLRQNKPLTEEDQDHYFNNVVSTLFDQEQPNHILFSFLENGVCIGYGGLVHINWMDKNAEISFIMNTALETERFHEIWTAYLNLIEKVAFEDLKFHKINTYAFDLRPHLYPTLIKAGFKEEARLKEQCFYENSFIDAIIHSKINNSIVLRKATLEDIHSTFDWASNKKVRRYAIQKDDIHFENHKEWFSKKIKSSDCVYFIAELNKMPIGSVRFDIDENKVAVLSFLVEPKFHGKGYGKELLIKGCEHILKSELLTRIVAVVSVHNIASLKIFKSLGFNQASEIDSFITFDKKIEK